MERKHQPPINPPLRLYIYKRWISRISRTLQKPFHGSTLVIPLMLGSLWCSDPSLGITRDYMEASPLTVSR
jgi:hypothetical protein